MNKIVLTIAFYFFTCLAYATVDNRTHKAEPIVSISAGLLEALNVAIIECKRRNFNIEAGDINIYKNAKNYIFDFGKQPRDISIRGAKAGTVLIIAVDMKTYEVVQIVYPK